MKGSFARNFEALLKEVGDSQAKAAKRLRMTQAAVSYLVSGKRSPSQRTIHQIAAEYGVLPGTLESGTLDELSKELTSYVPPRPGVIRETYSGERVGMVVMPPWMMKLKGRWKTNPEERSEILLGIKVLLKDEFEEKKLVEWLNS